FHSLLKTEDQLRAENKELRLRIKEQETNANAFHELEMRLARVEGELVRCKSQLDIAVAEKGDAKRETTLIKAEFASYREETLAYYFERQKAHNLEMKALKSSILSIRVPEFYLHGVVPYHAISLNKKSCLSLGMPKVNNRKLQFSHFETVGSTYTTEKYVERNAIKNVSQSRMGTYMDSFHRRYHGLFDPHSEQWRQEQFKLDQFELALFGRCPSSIIQQLEMYHNWYKMGLITEDKLEELKVAYGSVKSGEDFDPIQFEMDHEASPQFLAEAAEADLAIENALCELGDEPMDAEAVEAEYVEESEIVKDENDGAAEKSVFDNPIAELGPRRRSRS
ncbi:hypothetical protein HDU99_005786, partial [Rhizoclosmatium hyalinum]